MYLLHRFYFVILPFLHMAIQRCWLEKRVIPFSIFAFQSWSCFMCSYVLITATEEKYYFNQDHYNIPLKSETFQSRTGLTLSSIFRDLSKWSIYSKKCRKAFGARLTLYYIDLNGLLADFASKQFFCPELHMPLTELSSNSIVFNFSR